MHPSIANERPPLLLPAIVSPGRGICCFNDLYLPLWQNVLIRRLLLHPAGNRFHSGDLQKP